MPKGISVHVGVSRTNAPGISLPELKGCEHDACEMHSLATARNFVSPGPLLNQDATFDRVVNAITTAANNLVGGDFFLFTFSGHGTRRGTEDKTEKDMKDETLVLFDRVLIDNVLRRILWPSFAEGVRVVAVSDSCHSGGVFLLHDVEAENKPLGPLDEFDNVKPSLIKNAPTGVIKNHFSLLRDFYSKLRETIPDPAPPVKASFLLIGACCENEKAVAGEPNSPFTAALLKTVNDADSYDNLLQRITGALENDFPFQHPVVTPLGKPLIPEFRTQRPFVI